MNKCCVQTEQQATIKKSLNLFTMQSNGNGRRMSESGDDDDGDYCQMQITDETRGLIKRRRQTVFDFFEQTFQLYSVEELIFCFNGGKDCTVLLDLLMQYLKIKKIDSKMIPMLYIESDDTFEEINEFVYMCVEQYNVRLIKYKDSLKSALTHMTLDMPCIKAVFVGSRNTDPYCENLQPMQKTDNDWPEMMRLNPLLQWSYYDIWHYIHMYKVPYCCLYARGFTSIGYKSNTLPNPLLRKVDCSENSTDDFDYMPAWELSDPTKERAGRVARSIPN